MSWGLLWGDTKAHGLELKNNNTIRYVTNNILFLYLLLVLGLEVGRAVGELVGAAK